LVAEPPDSSGADDGTGVLLAIGDSSGEADARSGARQRRQLAFGRRGHTDSLTAGGSGVVISRGGSGMAGSTV
jgi:hypothetical protein